MVAHAAAVSCYIARDNADKQLKTCVFEHVKEHQKSDMIFIEKHNKATVPYIWANSATDTPEKLETSKRNTL